MTPANAEHHSDTMTDPRPNPTLSPTPTGATLCFGADHTERWPCRAGDVVLWFPANGGIARRYEVNITDAWEMRAGSHLLITNRWDDLPEWFTLHPSEASGACIPPMMAKLETGWRPTGKAEPSNAWRIRAGDRVAWVGEPRPGFPRDGILALIDFRASSLLCGIDPNATIEDLIVFGAPGPDGFPVRTKAWGQEAVRRVEAMGQPRTLTTTWTLG